MPLNLNMDSTIEQTVREMIRHENDLTNHRTTWLIVVEGLMFSSLGSAWATSQGGALVTILAVMGISMALAGWSAMLASQFAVRRLVAYWDSVAPSGYAGPGVTGLRARNQKLLPGWHWFPLILCAGWAAILIINLRRL